MNPAAVLEQELSEIRSAREGSVPDRQSNETDEPLAFGGERELERAANEELCGLALSGGGIRSATFNLGVLQALAELKLLRRLDYLSTVSGGGYIGSWLTAWIHRDGGVDAVEQQLANSVGRKPRCVQFLREHSNYLTPRTGVFGADTWAAISIYLRNLSLNLTILTGVLFALVIVPRLLLSVFPSAADLGTDVQVLKLSDWVIGGADLAAVLILLPAVVMAGVNLRVLDRVGRPQELTYWLSKQSTVLALIVAPALVASFFIAASAWKGEPPLKFSPWSNFLVGVSAAWIGMWVILVLVWHVRRSPRQGPEENGRARVMWRTVFAAVVSAVLAGLLAALLLGAIDHTQVSATNAAIWMTLGVPAVIAILSASVVLNLGLMGCLVSEEVREWWSRLGGWLLIASIAWIGLCGISLFGPVLLRLMGALGNVPASVAWAGTTLFGVWAGRSPSTSGKEPSRLPEMAASVAPYVFVVGLLLLISTFADVVLDSEIDVPAKGCGGETCTWLMLATNHWDQMMDQPLLPMAWMSLASFGAALLLSWRVDINAFSLQPLYRNRLVRCYLGASHPNRNAHPFTGFDPHDDIPLRELGKGRALRPFPLINVALNLVDGKDLATQERKAASFTMSPLHCGFGEKGYRRTRFYEGGALTLGEAFATSGAAASPNMGYHSSPALAFLMTVFNVRLGMWLHNPALEKSDRPWWPNFSLFALLNELLGNTTDDARLVYLSDGGHFDNLGIYELLRRRCRFIIACDASADPHIRFDDLGGAIRKCRTDLGVDIIVDTKSLSIDPKSGRSACHCAVAQVRYSDGSSGTILYLKASLTGQETVDVLNYAAGDATFPHQSTADQWFDESQFESYRRLGYQATRTVFETAVGDAAHPRGLESIFNSLRERWYPPTDVASGTFARHSAALAVLTERLRQSPRLAFLDAQIYPSWPDFMAGTAEERRPYDLWLPTDAAERRDGFYYCSSLIEFMENVYTDLQLDLHRDHPDNRGWMNLFRHWAWCGMLRVTWALTAATYGARFQTFCREHLGLDIGHVTVEPTKKEDLNFVERELLEKCSSGQPYAIKLSVPDPSVGADGSSARKLDFTVGFALVSGRELVYLRVQDHLRKMGLAREAMRCLLGGGLVSALTKEPPQAITEHERSAGMDRLQRLYRSVQIELNAGLPAGGGKGADSLQKA